MEKVQYVTNITNEIWGFNSCEDLNSLLGSDTM